VPTPWYPASSNTANRNLRGWKRYELTNHLGNVLSVVSDKHLSQDDGDGDGGKPGGFAALAHAVYAHCAAVGGRGLLVLQEL
jgi:hypothetical protein